MYRDLIARKVLSLDELMQRREKGVVMSSGDGDTLDLALLALQDAQSKLDRFIAIRDELCADHQDDDTFDAGVRYAVHMLTPEPPK